MSPWGRPVEKPARPAADRLSVWTMTMLIFLNMGPSWRKNNENTNRSDQFESAFDVNGIGGRRALGKVPGLERGEVCVKLMKLNRVANWIISLCLYFHIVIVLMCHKGSCTSCSRNLCFEFLN